MNIITFCRNLTITAPRPSVLQMRHLVFTIFASLLIATPQAFAVEKKYAAFVVHADSGDVLFDRYSTLSRYPASLTKMMTLYLLFEELEAGQKTLKTKLKVSKSAASQPPSKLGLRTGRTITVEDAIKALIVKSANDVAVVVAESISGSEWRFARKMTAKARSLGMRKTTFRNASGLPNSKQRTTARDMAELGRRLYQDFPQYRHYLKSKKFVWGKRTYTTHNSLVKNYQGADGIKTGYTRASGFNLTTTAERDGHRLIGVVLGGRSSYTRDRHMREILDKAFGQIKKKPALVASLVRNPPTPRLKNRPATDGVPTIAENSLLQAALQDAGNGLTSSPTITALNSGSTRAGDRPNDDSLAGLIAGITDGAPNGTLGATTNLTASNLNAAAFDRLDTMINREVRSYEAGEGDIDESAIETRLDWSVQIGAYSTADYAHRQLEDAATRAGLHQSIRQVIALNPNSSATLFRARFFFSTKQEAGTSCKRLKQKGIGCFVTNDVQG